ncbi:MAG: amidohydrolase family protein [Armatimonadota bacterium]
MPVIDVNAEVGTTPIWGVPFTDANLIRSMNKYAVEKTITASTLAHSCDFKRGNAQVAKVCTTNNNIKGCLVVNVNYPEQSQDDMKTYLAEDYFAGLLISNGQRGRPVTLEEAEELLNAYRRYIKPVFLRVNNQESLLAANEIAKEFVQMKFILLGMGGDDWRLATMLAEKTLNLVLEISGSFSPDKIQFAVEHIGSHRMMYGSSLPYSDPSTVIGLVEDANITDLDKKNIFENCARRIFGWKA